MSNAQPDQNESGEQSARASRQRAAKSIFRFFFASGWILLALELFYLYRDPDFSYFDLFLSSLSALCFLSAWQFRILAKRQPGEPPPYHPIMIPMSLLFLVMLFALVMLFFG